jgi:hypothetical protein
LKIVITIKIDNKIHNDTKINSPSSQYNYLLKIFFKPEKIKFAAFVTDKIIPLINPIFKNKNFF